jgi:hypothetical protein
MMLLIAVSVIWSAAIGVIGYRVLGVSIASVDGRPAVFLDEILIHGLDAVPLAFLVSCSFLACLLVARLTFRWWLIALAWLVVGTPVALLSARRIADYLWTLNRGGTPWEGVLPAAIGIAAGWLIACIVDSWLDRYRIVIVRQADQRRSPCPRCGYELYGSTSGVCPECGWSIPPQLRGDSSI